MSATGVPDFLSTLSLGRAQRRIRADMERAQTELVTGQTADRMGATRGDPMRAFALENNLSAIDSRLPLLSLAKSRSAATQNALETAQEAVGDFGVRLLGFAMADATSEAKAMARDAKAILGQVMSALNVNVSGRYVFGGDDAQSPPLADVDTMLADVTSAYRSELDTDPDVATTAYLQVWDAGAYAAAPWDVGVAHYFGRSFNGKDPVLAPASPVSPADDGKIDAAAVKRFANDQTGGDNTTIYSGGEKSAPSVELAVNARLSYSIQADDDGIRDLLMNLSVVAVVADEGAPTDADLLSRLEVAAHGIVGALDGLTNLRERLGHDERRIEDAEVRNQSEKATLEKALGLIMNVDAYEAASRVTAFETQLQTVYAMTARSASLNLLNYIR